MREFKAVTIRLPAGSIDADLTAVLNRYAREGWRMEHIGEGVSTKMAGGILAVDRLLVFSRPMQESPALLTEENRGTD